MKRIIAIASLLSVTAMTEEVSYPIVDTGQIRCFDDKNEVEFPKKDKAFFGQDGHYLGNQPSYKNNGNGTVSDRITKLMWTADPGEKMTLEQAKTAAKKCRLGGYSDWRVPTIKQLYSLIQMNGLDPDPMSTSTEGLTPYIDTNYFKFQYGRASHGERIIDSQYGSSSKYVSTTMKGDATLFGVNFADGRIKGYGMKNPRTRKANTFYFIFVRGNKSYGKNMFKNNGDGTITDRATGLTWIQVDSAALRVGGMNWEDALKWSESLKYAGKSDWRLPNIKELNSIIDYTRSPDTTKSAAINPIFKLTPITNEGGKKDFAQYWSSTTHKSSRGASAGSYFAFGRSLGFMKDRRTGKTNLLDVHGAGSQRSDPKSGDPSRYPTGRGPQGDVIRINNYVLCVRGGVAKAQSKGPEVEQTRRGRGRGQSSNEGRRKPRSNEGGSQSGSNNPFMKREDRNGDGKVTRDEFRGPSHHFGRLDKNGDGYIDESEAPTRKPRR